MKFRLNFVSNSSSSSFIIIGQRINLKKITMDIVKKGKIYALASQDSWIEDGKDFFQITPEMWELFLKKGARLNFWEVDELICEGGDVSKKDIPGEVFHVEYMNITYHRTENLKNFKQRYIDEV